jgi:hypothetical protein
VVYYSGRFSGNALDTRFREATARAIAMNAMRDTDNLFVEKQNAEQ